MDLQPKKVFAIMEDTCDATVGDDEQNHVVLAVLHLFGHGANVVDHRGVTSGIGERDCKK